MTRISDDDLRFDIATRVVHAGQEPDPATGAIMTPIFQTSTYVQPKLGEHKGFEYARTRNPTRDALERNLASLEGARHGFAFSSGMAATEAVLKLLSSGDHVVSGENLYGGSHRLMVQVLERFGLSFTFVDERDPKNFERAIRSATKIIYVETPTNPMMRLVDLRAFRRHARLRRPRNLVKCDRKLLDSLRSLTREQVDRELGPFLQQSERQAVMIRRDLIVELFEQKIKQQGESKVLFDLL